MKISKEQINKIIFDTDTPLGKAFDVALLIVILLSVSAILLESIESIHIKYGQILHYIEWTVSILFTIEYFLRIYSAKKPIRYIFSFFGIVDILSFLPTYLSILLPGSHYISAFRIIRLLRVFQIFKLVRYVSEAQVLAKALKSSLHKITVFLFYMVSIVIIIGVLMYLIEGSENGFTSIPKSIYWAIVTITTVGYGDIAPKTIPGELLASIVMILGYSIIAVPTGIVSVELNKASKTSKNMISCNKCNSKTNENNANYCNICGYKLN